MLPVIQTKAALVNLEWSHLKTIADSLVSYFGLNYKYYSGCIIMIIHELGRFMVQAHLQALLMNTVLECNNYYVRKIPSHKIMVGSAEN